MFSIFLITIISICWVVRLWCCVAFHYWSLLHCSHIGNFRLLSLHFQPLFSRVDERRRFWIFIVVIIVARTSAFWTGLAVSWPMSTVFSMWSAWTTRATRHFTFVVRYSLTSRSMSSSGSRVIGWLTFYGTGSLTLASIRISIARRSRTNGLGTRINSEQATLLTFRPTSTSRTAGWVRNRMMTVLVNGVVVVESRRNAACGSVCIINAVEWKRKSLEI